MWPCMETRFVCPRSRNKRDRKRRRSWSGTLAAATRNKRVFLDYFFQNQHWVKVLFAGWSIRMVRWRKDDEQNGKDCKRQRANVMTKVLIPKYNLHLDGVECNLYSKLGFKVMKYQVWTTTIYLGTIIFNVNYAILKSFHLQKSCQEENLLWRRNIQFVGI